MKTATKPAPAKTATGRLKQVYESVEAVMRKHSPPLRAGGAIQSAAKRSFQLMVPKPVAIPGAYGGKPVDLALASLILQKNYVGFYLMCIYTNVELKKKLSPNLLKVLKGKSCFHLKEVDEELLRDIEQALDLGLKAYAAQGWV